MATTLESAIKRLRESILDDTGGTGVEWADITQDDAANELLRWSNEELAYFIQQGMNQVYRNSLIGEDTDPSFDITVQAGIALYPLNDKILQIVVAELVSQGKKLEPLDIRDVSKIKSWTAKAGTPTGYIVNYISKTIRLFPVPVVDDSVKLVVYRLPKETLTWDKPSSVLELSDEYVNSMLHWAAHLAYLKDDPNCYDPSKSAMFKAMFVEEFSDTSAYSETRKRRNSKRSISYGGL